MPAQINILSNPPEEAERVFHALHAMAATRS